MLLPQSASSLLSLGFSTILLVSSSRSFTTMVQATPEPDPTCDAVRQAFYVAIFLGGACDADGDVCPTSCVEQFSVWHTACAGKFFSSEDGDTGAITVEKYNPTSFLFITSILDEACKEEPLDFFLSLDNDQAACEDWLEVNQVIVFTAACSNECTENCQTITRNMFATCASTDTLTDEDGDVSTAIEINFIASLFRAPECNDLAKTLSFEGVGASAAPTSTAHAPVLSPAPITAVANNNNGLVADAECDAAFVTLTTAIVIGSSCDETTNVYTTTPICPEACGRRFSELYADCWGKLYTKADSDRDTAVEFSSAIVVSLSLFVSDACQHVPVESLLLLDQGEITCSDWMELTRFSSIYFCAQECTDQCKQIMRSMYAFCSADAIIFDDDGDTSTASEVELFSSLLRAQECNDLANTLTFTGDSRGDPIPTNPPVVTIAPVALPFEVSSTPVGVDATNGTSATTPITAPSTDISSPAGLNGDASEGPTGAGVLDTTTTAPALTATESLGEDSVLPDTSAGNQAWDSLLGGTMASFVILGNFCAW